MPHTPGPWIVKGPVVRPAGPSFDQIAAVQVSNSPDWEANAHLIAAAPDLLAALQVIVRVADRKTDEFDAARAAIAKAIRVN